MELVITPPLKIFWGTGLVLFMRTGQIRCTSNGLVSKLTVTYTVVLCCALVLTGQVL